MLQTSVIKADASSPAVAGGASKEKDAASSLEATFSAYYSQMMAVLPAATPQAGVLPAPAVATPVRTGTAAVDAAPAAVRSGASAASRPTDSAGSSASAAAASTPASTPAAGQDTPAAPSKAQDPGQGQASADTAARPQDRQAAQAAAAPDHSVPTQGSATQARSEGAPDPVPSAQTAPGPAPVAVAKTDDHAQAALDQAYPGARFQVQVDDGAALTSTAKAPLTEFLTPILQAGAGATSASDAQATPAPAAVPAATAAQLGLAAALQAPVAATQAALAGLPATPQAGTAPTAAGNGQAAAIAGVQALGAGAQPGATGAVRVTAAASTESSLPTRQESPLTQVDGTIRFLVKNQDQSAELQLHPESLGRLQIKLKVEGSVVHAKVWASEAATVPLLQDQKALLEASLKNQGLSLGSFDLQHGRRNDQAPLPSQEAAPAAVTAVSGAARGAADTAALAEPATAHNGRIEIVA